MKLNNTEFQFNHEYFTFKYIKLFNLLKEFTGEYTFDDVVNKVIKKLNMSRHDLHSAMQFLIRKGKILKIKNGNRIYPAIYKNIGK